MKKEDIIAAIESKVKTYSLWQIGLTHDPSKRKEEWAAEGRNTAHWTDWKADSLTDAQDIESHFISKGMKGGTGGDLFSRRDVYVYVF